MINHNLKSLNSNAWIDQVVEDGLAAGGGEGADSLSDGQWEETFKLGDGDTVLDFKYGTDLIDLRRLGVTASNFAEKAAAIKDGSSTELNAGDASTTFAGSASIEIKDFLFGSDNDASSLLGEVLAIVSRTDGSRSEFIENMGSNTPKYDYNSNFVPYDYSGISRDLFIPLEHDSMMPLM